MKGMTRTKRMLSVLLALALVLAGLPMYSMEVQAAEFETYRSTYNGAEIIIIRHYTGNGGDVTIPSQMNGVPVTTIEFGAFENCSNVVSVSIPDSVTKIGFQAFKGCSSLEKINIPDSLTTIESGTFSGCSSLKEISIPAGVTIIQANVFDGCSSLERITVAEDNTAYDSRDNCNAIIRTESNKLIAGCENTVIPDSVTEIGDRAFDCRSGLTEISIPAGVTIIDYSAFKGCNSLTGINIPASVTNIRYSAFVGCSSLERITVAEGNTVYDSRNNCNAIIQKDRMQGPELVLGCKNTNIPSDVTSIGNYAFSGCSSLAGVSIPSGVTNIGFNAFSGCSSLAGISIPSGVKYISSSVFEGCSSLTGINIPSDVMSISSYAFKDCSSLTEIRIPAGVKSIEEGVFSGCSNLSEISIPDSVTSIGKSAFSGCSNLTGISIPASVTSIGEGAFAGCSSLTGEISIPAGVTSIGVNAFEGCNSLEGITVAEGNTKYDSRDDCNAIIETAGNTLMLGCKNAVIPDGVESIAERAFYDCSGLTGEISIPSGVTSIGNDAFNGCSSLMGINIPDSVTKIGERVFWNCSGLEKITVAEGNTEYDSRNNCNAIIQNVPVQGSDKINTVLIYGCKNTVIPDGVTKIGNGAFYGCTSLKEIRIPSGVETIGNDAFSGCTGLTDIYIPDSVYGFGSGAFMACTSLMEIRIPCSQAWAMVFSPSSMGYSKYEQYGEKIKIPGFIICGERNSPVQRYAKSNGLEFRALDANDLSWADVVLEQDDYQYDGQEKTPAVTVKMDGKTLTPDTDYTVSYSNNTDVGTAEVTITATAMGDYLGDVTRTYTISRADISRAEVALEQESYVYDGTAKTPSVTVTLAGKTLNPDTDYTVSYDCNTDAGQAKVIVTGKGSYTKNVEKTYTISGADISQAEVILEQESYVYDGTAKTPSVTVMLAGKELALNMDYTVSYSNNIDEGIAEVTVTGTGNYAGKAEKTYTISKTSISAAEVILEQESYVYDGTAKTPSVTVMLAGKTLNPDTDYRVSYSDNTAAGQAKVAVTGTGIYKGDVEKTYTISKADISQAEVILEQESYVYDETAKTPSVTVKLNENTLVSGRDYRISYSDNTAAGTAKATVTGIGSCTGTAEKDFNISKADLSNAEVILEQESYVYDETAKTPSVTVTLEGTVFVPDRDYTVSYSDNIKVGTAEVTVTGIGSCSGSKKEYFSIIASGSATDPVKTDISPAAVTLDRIIYTYDGTAKTPSVTVMLFGKPLIHNTDYTISYSNNTNVGTAAVTVTGKGNYTGTKSVNFTIVKVGENPGQNPGTDPGTEPGVSGCVHKWGAWKSMSKATVFVPEKQKCICSMCGVSKEREYGNALKPYIKLTANSLKMQVKQSTNKFKVTGMARGDWLASVKSGNTKALKVSKVSRAGTFTLKAQKKTGTVQLTITMASGLKKTIKVSVGKAKVKTTKITLKSTKISLKRGKKTTLKPVITPVTSQEKVTYKSSNGKVASVSAKGVIAAKKKGTAKVTVVSGKKKVIVTVKVTK